MTRRLASLAVALLLLAGCSTSDGFATGETIEAGGPGSPVSITIVGLDTQPGFTRQFDLVLTFDVENNSDDEITIHSLVVTQRNLREYESDARTFPENATIAPGKSDTFDVRLRARTTIGEDLDRRRAPERPERILQARALVRLANGDEYVSVFEVPVPLLPY